MNACNSHRTGEELAVLNVPNICATGRLPDCAAQRFSEEFWKAVGKNHNFDVAFRSAVDILNVEVVQGRDQFIFLPGQALPPYFATADEPAECWRQKHATCVESELPAVAPALKQNTQSGKVGDDLALKPSAQHDTVGDNLALKPSALATAAVDSGSSTGGSACTLVNDSEGVVPDAPVIARLAFAVRKCDARLLDEIVTEAPHLLTSPLTYHGERFMTLAAKYGNKHAVQVGMEFGLVNQLKLGVHTTPLHTAAFYGQLEIMTMLLSSDGVNPNLVSRGGVRFFQMTVNGAEAHKKRRHQIYGALAKLSTSNEWGLKVGLDANELAEQLAACPHGGLEKLKAHYNEDPELATVFPGISRALRIEPAMSLEHLSMCMVAFVACGVVLMVEVVKRI